MKESKTKKILRIVFFPLVWLRRQYLHYYTLWQGRHHPQKLASKLYKGVMGKDLDWNNPKDLNEKINWLFVAVLDDWYHATGTGTEGAEQTLC